MGCLRYLLYDVGVYKGSLTVGLRSYTVAIVRNADLSLCRTPFQRTWPASLISDRRRSNGHQTPGNADKSGDVHYIWLSAHDSSRLPGPSVHCWFSFWCSLSARCPRYWDFGIHKPITCGDAKGACRVLDRARNRIKTDWKPNKTSRPLERLKVQTSAESTNAVIRGFESCHV